MADLLLFTNAINAIVLLGCISWQTVVELAYHDYFLSYIKYFI
jgi:hypothetical protein